MKKAFVTGAGGFIGSHLCERLVELGWDVTALIEYSSNNDRGWLNGKKAIKYVFGDVRDPGFVSDSIGNCLPDVVYHLAALIDVPYSFSAPQSYIDTNVKGTLNVLEACRRHAIPYLIHTSTSEVYGTAQFTPITERHPINPQSPYAASKVGADALVTSYVHAFGLPAVILRPFNTFGPRQSDRGVIASIVRQYVGTDKSIRLGDTSTSRDFVFVKDTVEAFVKAAISPLEFGVPYNVGTGLSYKILDIYNEVFKHVTEVKPLLDNCVGRLRPEGAEVKMLMADASAFKAVTGWGPRWTLTEGLRETFEWHQALGR